jgi:Uncharacterized conserved protein
MKTRALTAVVLTLAASAAFAAGKDFDRTLNVNSTPSVSISTGSGYIRVRPGSDSQVHVIGHVRPSNSWFNNDSESRVQQIVNHPPISQSGNTITIGDTQSRDLYRNISIDYDVTLPRASSIHARSGSGDVDVQDAGSYLKAESGSGNVHAHSIHGPADLQSGSGNIYLQQTASGDVRAQTGSGNIQLNDISGGLKAGTGSGDIQAGGNPTSDWKLDTGSGSIHLTLGSSAHFTLNASTGSGSISTAQPITMQGEINKHHITGSVNGEGPTIRVNTGSGDIDIK